MPDIESVVAQIEQHALIAVGITPYTRIIPGFFLKNFSVYAIKNSSDTDIIKQHMRVHILEDYQPALAKRVHGTGYLVSNHAFKAFLASRKTPPTIILNTISERTADELAQTGTKWIGNHPNTFADVAHKGVFRELIKKLGLPSLQSDVYTKEEFFASSWDTLQEKYTGPFVVQRADKEVGGNEGTFFVHNATDFTGCIEILKKDEQFGSILLSPFVNSHSTSMLGCTMEQGVLTGPLQLQLIDIPQALNGLPPNGIFFGNDIGFHPWDDTIEQQAQKIVEAVGTHLREQGYKGVFGIDFLYDKKRNTIYPNECNPRFTGSLMLYSLMLLQEKIPPMELFHLMAHLHIESNFNFDQINRALKTRTSVSHIAFSPRGITSMKLPLLAGVYEYNSTTPSLEYKRPGISLADIQNDTEFLLIDTVPTMGSRIEQAVPRLFKFIFPKSIAKSSYEIATDAGFLVERFARVLREAVGEKENS